jgi:hypothetical protein
MSRAASFFSTFGRTSAGVVGLGLRPVGAAVAVGVRIERRTRHEVADAVGALALATLDALLASRRTDEAIQRVLASPTTERALSDALRGPLVDALARDLARHAVIERVAGQLLADGAADRIAARMLEGPELERVVAGAVDSPAAERLVGRVIDSRMLDELFLRLLESPELWQLVEEIARSPAVTEAITQQSVGFADQFAAQVRRSSSDADAWVERAARRIRPPRHGDEGPFGGPADASAS